MADTKTEKQKVQEITEKLEEGIKELFESEKYKNYLNTMSKFHNYSFNNTLLIAMQKPDATLVAGFQAWKKNFERHVKKGEKGIRILAPAPYKVKEEQEKLDPETNEIMLDKEGKPIMEEVEVTIPAFRAVSVFDVSVKRHFTANSNITLFLRDLPVLRQFIAKKSFFYYGKITLFLKKRREDLFRSSQHNSISFIADNTISVSMCVLLFCAPIIRDFVRIKFNFRILPPQLP